MSKLSATAKPFSFNPSASTFVPSSIPSPPVNTQNISQNVNKTPTNHPKVNNDHQRQTRLPNSNDKPPNGQTTKEFKPSVTAKEWTPSFSASSSAPANASQVGGGGGGGSTNNTNGDTNKQQQQQLGSAAQQQSVQQQKTSQPAVTTGYNRAVVTPSPISSVKSEKENSSTRNVPSVRGTIPSSTTTPPTSNAKSPPVPASSVKSPTDASTTSSNAGGGNATQPPVKAAGVWGMGVGASVKSEKAFITENNKDIMRKKEEARVRAEKEREKKRKEEEVKRSGEDDKDKKGKGERKGKKKGKGKKGENGKEKGNEREGRGERKEDEGDKEDKKKDGRKKGDGGGRGSNNAKDKKEGSSNTTMSAGEKEKAQEPVLKGGILSTSSWGKRSTPASTPAPAAAPTPAPAVTSPQEETSATAVDGSKGTTPVPPTTKATASKATEADKKDAKVEPAPAPTATEKTPTTSGGGTGQNQQQSAPQPVQTWARQAATVPGTNASDDGKWAIRGQKLPDQKSDSQVGRVERGGARGDDKGGWARGKSLAPELYQPQAGEGNVVRFTAGMLLQQRLEFVAAPLVWSAPSDVKWTDADRVTQIMNTSTKGRIGGDVSRKGETAPELKDCKPLEVNEETRWKSGIIGGEQKEGPDMIKQKALVILNKLTMTNFDKLSSSFIQCGILSSPELLKDAIELVVAKAQQEPHFSEMYARLCLKMSNDEKTFKKIVVERCQTEFETDLDSKIAEKVKEFGEDEREYWKTLIKKYYLGHMRFIGELFKVELISIKVMVKILPTLLEEKDEEKIECFCKLMSVTGRLLEHQAHYYAQNNKPKFGEALAECWDIVIKLANSKGEISSRVKFMLQDLIEMKEKGWQVRRKEEKAKTISEIHRDVQREEQRQGSKGGRPMQSGGGRSSRPPMGGGDFRKSAKPTVDGDGWATVNKPNAKMGGSRGGSSFSSSNNDKKTSPKNANVAGGFAALSLGGNNDATPVKAMSVEEAGKVGASALKEFYTSGDLNEAVERWIEAIGGDLERGASVISKALDLVLNEGKEQEADKYSQVLLAVHGKEALTSDMIGKGFLKAFDFLYDIAIDAPLAPTHAKNIVLKAVEGTDLKLGFLGDAGEDFKYDGNAVKFAELVGAGEEVVSKLR